MLVVVTDLQDHASGRSYSLEEVFGYAFVLLVVAFLRVLTQDVQVMAGVDGGYGAARISLW